MEFKQTESAPHASKRKPYGELRTFIQNFVDSGIEHAQILNWELDYADAQSLAAVLCKTKSRMGYNYIRVSRVLDDVYLTNTLAAKEETKQLSHMEFKRIEDAPYMLKRPRGEIKSIIEKFVKSGLKSIEITNWECNYKNAQSCAAAFLGAVQRFGFTHVRVSRVLNNVYLTNMSIIK